MNVREWLNSFKHYDVEIESIRNELVYFEKHWITCGEARIGELKERLEQLMEKKIMLTRIIDNIKDPVARAVYRARYIMGYNWSTIAEKCGGMSERNARYIHDQALSEVEGLSHEHLEIAL